MKREVSVNHIRKVEIVSKVTQEGRYRLTPPERLYVTWLNGSVRLGKGALDEGIVISNGVARELAKLLLDDGMPVIQDNK